MKWSCSNGENDAFWERPELKKTLFPLVAINIIVAILIIYIEIS